MNVVTLPSQTAPEWSSNQLLGDFFNPKIKPIKHKKHLAVFHRPLNFHHLTQSYPQILDQLRWFLPRSRLHLPLHCGPAVLQNRTAVCQKCRRQLGEVHGNLAWLRWQGLLSGWLIRTVLKDFSLVSWAKKNPERSQPIPTLSGSRLESLPQTQRFFPGSPSMGSIPRPSGCSSEPSERLDGPTRWRLLARRKMDLSNSSPEIVTKISQSNVFQMGF